MTPKKIKLTKNQEMVLKLVQLKEANLLIDAKAGEICDDELKAIAKVKALPVSMLFLKHKKFIEKPFKIGTFKNVLKQLAKKEQLVELAEYYFTKSYEHFYRSNLDTYNYISNNVDVLIEKSKRVAAAKEEQHFQKYRLSKIKNSPNGLGFISVLDTKHTFDETEKQSLDDFSSDKVLSFSVKSKDQKKQYDCEDEDVLIEFSRSLPKLNFKNQVCHGGSRQSSQISLTELINLINGVKSIISEEEFDKYNVMASKRETSFLNVDTFQMLVLDFCELTKPNTHGQYLLTDLFNYLNNLTASGSYKILNDELFTNLVSVLNDKEIIRVFSSSIVKAIYKNDDLTFNSSNCFGGGRLYSFEVYLGDD